MALTEWSRLYKSAVIIHYIVTSCTIQTNYSYSFWWHYSSEYDYTIPSTIRNGSEYEANIRYIPTNCTCKIRSSATSFVRCLHVTVLSTVVCGMTSTRNTNNNLFSPLLLQHGLRRVVTYCTGEELRDLLSTLESLNATEMLRAIETAGLRSSMATDNITVIAPINAAFDALHQPTTVTARSNLGLDYIKLFRTKLFSYFLTLIHRLETWTFRHSHYDKWYNISLASLSTNQESIRRTPPRPSPPHSA